MPENAFFWSITAADNDDADAAVAWPEGMLPGAVNNSARAIMAGVARLLKDLNGTVATTGSANAYLATSNSSHTTYTTGTLITVKANHTNTGAATLDFNSFGAKAIRAFDPSGETALVSGEIQSGCTYDLRYDSALNSGSGAWVLKNPTRGENAGTIKIWTSDTLPNSGWYFANGTVKDQATDAALFAVVGTTYNTVGEGAAQFRLPDLCGRVPFGSDDMGAVPSNNRITTAECGIDGDVLGAAGGVQSVALSVAQLAAHTHNVALTTTAGGSHSHTVSGTVDSGGSHTHTGTTATESVGLPPGAPSTTNGTFSGLTSNGWGGTVNNGAPHTHSFTTDAGGAHTHTFTASSVSTQADHTHSVNGNSASTGSDASHSNMPPALIVNYIIKR